jgi:hypothetical protein
MAKKHNRSHSEIESHYGEVASALSGPSALENPKKKGGRSVNRSVESSYSQMADDMAEATGQFK